MKLVKRSGFTLVELLVVIAIIGILAAVVLTSLNSARQKARDVRRVADIRQLANAINAYADENNQYPTGVDSEAFNKLVPDYISLVPTDLRTGVSYEYRTDSCPNPQQEFMIRTRLEVNTVIGSSDFNGQVCGVACNDSLEYCISS